MFSCCWPQKKAQKKQKQLQQKLLDKESKPAEAQIQIEKPLQPEQKKQMPINKKLQEMDRYNSLQLNISISTGKYQPQQIPAQMKNSVKRARLGSFQQVQKIKKKSQLWQEEAGTKILFFNHRKEEEMMFAFKIIHIKTSQSHPLNYTLNPHKNTHKIRSKPVQMSLNLIVWNKNIAQTKSTVKNIESESNIKNIFGAYKREDKKGMKSLYDNDEINEIIELSNSCLRLSIFDKIIISCLNEKDFHYILQFCQKVTQFYELEDFSKVIWVFPQELTLSQINLILSKLFRKYLISQKLQNIVKFLGFHVELVEGDLVEPFIIVKSNLLMNEQEIYSKQFEIKLELAIGLLMIEINYNNFKTYEKVLDHFFVDMTLIKYLKMIQFIHKEKKDYLRKLEELHLFEANQLLEIQNSSKIQQKVINENEKCIIIKQKAKKRMGQLFTDYRTAHTPVEQLQNNKKKEWDDDLKEQDIKVVHVSKEYSQHQVEDNYNIFEEIDDSYVDNASLEILTGIEFKEHQ